MVNTKRKRVLILHGWMHSARRYARLKTDLETYGNAQVTLYEFPGFGSTPSKKAAVRGSHEPGQTVSGGKAKKHGDSMMTEYLKALCAYLNIHHFDYIIGHSMGGSLALRAAAENCSEESLILLSPEYGGIALLRPLIFFKPLIRVLLKLVKTENRASTFFIKLMSLFTINKFSKIDDIIAEDVRRADGNTAAELMFELARDKWKVEKDCQPAGKMLLIIGEKDRIISRRQMAKLRNDAGDCRMYVLKGIGHTAVLEDYEGLLNVILKWMKRVEGR